MSDDLITDPFPPWFIRSGLDPARLQEIADRADIAIAAALREIGRPDLINGCELGNDPQALADKRIVHRANVIAAGATNLNVAPCLVCWLADVEDECPGVDIGPNMADRHGG